MPRIFAQGDVCLDTWLILVHFFYYSYNIDRLAYKMFFVQISLQFMARNNLKKTCSPGFEY